MGAKCKPTRLKILEGNRGKRPLPENEIVPESNIPVPPGHLDGYALEEWGRMVEGLHGIGLLYEVDTAVFAAYCVSYSRWRRAQEQLNNEELVIRTTSGNYIQNPIIGIANKAAQDMVKFALEFGLSPSARARLAIDPGRNKKSKFDGLIKSGKK